MTKKNPQKGADLHIHTTFSDGTYTPEKVVSIGIEKGLGAVAITDHDSVGGIAPAMKFADGKEIEVVPGTELSSYVNDHGIHVVGLYIDTTNPRLLEHLDFFRDHRRIRGEKIVQKLNELGIKVTVEDILEQSGSGSMGRPHIAKALLKAGAVNSLQEAFDRYIGGGKPAYVPKFKIDPKKAAEIIHDARGVAILAHPGISTRSDKEIYNIMDMGMDGIEIVHSKHNPEQTAHFKQMAQASGWLMSGGSDCHGDNSNYSQIGDCLINEKMLDNIRNRKR